MGPQPVSIGEATNLKILFRFPLRRWNVNFKPLFFPSLLFLAIATIFLFAADRNAADRKAVANLSVNDKNILSNSARMLVEGRQIFRFDTFGDEAFWGDTLKLHQAIAGEKLGGVGPGVSPKTALAVGLKVDSDALPSDLVEAIRKGHVDLGARANTLALLRLTTVAGL